uniref:Uncharacterized protein n=1 Tax=Arundo donax TaxID=35708 RepID=A0A0A8ZAT2_ARUDO
MIFLLRSTFLLWHISPCLIFYNITVISE